MVERTYTGAVAQISDIVAQDGSDIAIVCLRHDGAECAANALLIAAALICWKCASASEHVSPVSVDQDVAQIIRMACDAVEKATVGKV